jgi:hypothetical protein
MPWYGQLLLVVGDVVFNGGMGWLSLAVGDVAVKGMLFAMG